MRSPRRPRSSQASKRVRVLRFDHAVGAVDGGHVGPYALSGDGRTSSTSSSPDQSTSPSRVPWRAWAPGASATEATGTVSTKDERGDECQPCDRRDCHAEGTRQQRRARTGEPRRVADRVLDVAVGQPRGHYRRQHHEQPPVARRGHPRSPPPPPGTASATGRASRRDRRSRQRGRTPSSRATPQRAAAPPPARMAAEVPRTGSRVAVPGQVVAASTASTLSRSARGRPNPAAHGPAAEVAPGRERDGEQGADAELPDPGRGDEEREPGLRDGSTIEREHERTPPRRR